MKNKKISMLKSALRVKDDLSKVAVNTILLCLGEKLQQQAICAYQNDAFGAVRVRKCY